MQDTEGMAERRTVTSAAKLSPARVRDETKNADHACMRTRLKRQGQRGVESTHRKQTSKYCGLKQLRSLHA